MFLPPLDRHIFTKSADNTLLGDFDFLYDLNEIEKLKNYLDNYNGELIQHIKSLLNTLYDLKLSFKHTQKFTDADRKEKNKEFKNTFETCKAVLANISQEEDKVFLEQAIVYAVKSLKDDEGIKKILRKP